KLIVGGGPECSFFLRTGKALETRVTEVAIKFKQAPFAMFRDTPIDRRAQNFLVLGIQPAECISLQFNAKVPGPSISIGGGGMTVRFKDYFDAAPSIGYETLIYHFIIGDAMPFFRGAGVGGGGAGRAPFRRRRAKRRRRGTRAGQTSIDVAHDSA